MDYHIPVLAKEVIDQLNPSPGKTFIDATLGNGGHTLLLLKSGANVVGIEQDAANLEIAQNRINSADLSSSFTPIQGNFNDLKSIFENKIKQKTDGLLLDLGLSSNQLMASGRGFSFNDSSSLDMRLNPDNSDQPTAENIINTASFDELFEIFTKYAQEKLSKPLILRIIRERQKSPIKTGARLADIIRKYYEEKHIRSRIDPATKIFMALRIAVNDEYFNLKNVLSASFDILKPGGVVAVISFHSGEDRIVKNFIRANSQRLTNLTPKAILPGDSEIKSNPLSRSAVLRSYRII